MTHGLSTSAGHAVPGLTHYWIRESHQAALCEQAQRAEEEEFLLERLPNKRSFPGLLAKGRNGHMCRRFYPRKHLSPYTQPVHVRNF